MKTKHDQPSPFSVDLLFEENPLSGASAHVIVLSSSKDEDGTTYLTPDCKTQEELRQHIDRLHSELEIAYCRGLKSFIKSRNRSKQK